MYVIRGLHRHSLGRLAPKSNDLKGEYQWYQSADISSHVELDKRSRAKQAQDRRIKTEQLRRTDPQQYAALMQHERGGVDALTQQYHGVGVSPLYQQQEQYMALQQLQANRHLNDSAMPKVSNPINKLKTFYNEKKTEINRRLNTKPPVQQYPSSSSSSNQYAHDLERAKRESLTTAPRRELTNRSPIDNAVNAPPSAVRDDDVELAMAISASIAANNGVIAQSPKGPKQQQHLEAVKEEEKESVMVRAHDFLNLDSMGNEAMQCEEEKNVDDDDPFALLIREYSSNQNVGSAPIVSDDQVTEAQAHYYQNDKGDGGVCDNQLFVDHFAMNQDVNMNADALEDSVVDDNGHNAVHYNSLPHNEMNETDKATSNGHRKYGSSMNILEDDLWRMLEASLTSK